MPPRHDPRCSQFMPTKALHHHIHPRHWRRQPQFANPYDNDESKERQGKYNPTKDLLLIRQLTKFIRTHFLQSGPVRFIVAKSGPDGKGSIGELPCGIQFCLYCGCSKAPSDPSHWNNCGEYAKTLKDSSPAVETSPTARKRTPDELSTRATEDTSTSGGTSKAQGLLGALNCHPIAKLRLPSSKTGSGGGGGESVLSDLTTRDNASPPLKKKRTEWACLACNQDGCRYELGVSVMNVGDGQENEYDPMEDEIMKAGTAPADYEEIKTTILFCVRSAYTSPSMFPHHKYMEGQSFDMKIQKWLGLKVVAKDTIGKYYYLLRRTVKEVLRYKRQVSIERMEENYVGES